MPRIYVEFAGLKQIGSSCETISSKINAIQSDFQRTVRQLDWDIKFESNINNTAAQITRKLEQYIKTIENYKKFLDDVHDEYVQLDNEKGLSLLEEQNPAAVSTGKFQTFIDEFFSNYGWKEALAGANYAGTVYNLISDIRKGKRWQDLLKSGKGVSNFISKVAKDYKNYKKIGNAVGTKKAMTWWAKNALGLKPLGRVSTAKNPFTRFANNLTNKTSPFNAKLKGIVEDFNGKKGAGKAIASWASVAATGVSNWFSNKEEQANSNGTMSDGRVVAETITETIVDIALDKGAEIVVGAAISAALPVAAPGILVVAASSAIVVGINAGVKAVTGQSVTEWISDTIINAGTAIGKAVGSAAKSVSSAVGSWFRKLSFT